MKYTPGCPCCENAMKRPRFYKGGSAKAMGVVDCYIVARKRGASPFLITLKEWLALPFVG